MLLQKEEPKVNFTGDISLREERNKFRMWSGCQYKKGVMQKYKQNTYQSAHFHASYAFFIAIGCNKIESVAQDFIRFSRSRIQLQCTMVQEQWGLWH